MRELKFRAWHKPTQLMDDVVLIDFYNEKIGILYADPVMQCESIQKYDFNEMEIMQYTGLKDKNGVEIYEGDIVKVNEKDVHSDIRLKDTYHVLVVEYFKEEVGFILKNKKTVGKYFGRLEYMFSEKTFEQCEIISNIYENPELLEVE